MHWFANPAGTKRESIQASLSSWPDLGQREKESGWAWELSVVKQQTESYSAIVKDMKKKIYRKT